MRVMNNAPPFLRSARRIEWSGFGVNTSFRFIRINPHSRRSFSSRSRGEPAQHGLKPYEVSRENQTKRTEIDKDEQSRRENTNRVGRTTRCILEFVRKSPKKT